jgi:hypothetical protein
MRWLVRLAVAFLAGYGLILLLGAHQTDDSHAPYYYVLDCGHPKLQFGPFMQLYDCDSRKEIVSWMCTGKYPTPESTKEHATRWQTLCKSGSEACHCERHEGLTPWDAALDQEITAFMDEPHGRDIAPLPGEVSKPPVPLPGEVGKHDEHGRKGGAV